nr:hypothetical protein [Tanacetum cinerariifolium]
MTYSWFQNGRIGYEEFQVTTNVGTNGRKASLGKSRPFKAVEAYADKPMAIFKYTIVYKKDYISKTTDRLSTNVPGIPLDERNLEVPNLNSGRDIVMLDDRVSRDANAPSTDIIAIPDDEEPVGYFFLAHED